MMATFHLSTQFRCSGIVQAYLLTLNGNETTANVIILTWNFPASTGRNVVKRVYTRTVKLAHPD